MNPAGAPLIAAVRGPVMLITLGVLFAVDHFGRFDFGKTWPVLIIAFGVMKLLEWATARRKPDFLMPGGQFS